MEPPKAVIPVGAVRERVIQTLTEAFANDVLSVTELEDRLEKAYRASTAEEALALIAGLPQRSAQSVGVALAESESSMGMTHRERFVSIMSSQNRRGVWNVPREMSAVGVFSDTTIDYTH